MAVITGMKAMPSTVSMTCAVFSAPLSAGLVSADPVRSMSPRYTVLLIEYRVASSTKPTPITASSAVKTSPNLCQTSRRSRPTAARAGLRRRVSGLRGVPSATASTRSAGPPPGGSSRGDAWSSAGVARPQITAPGATSAGRAT